MSFDSPVLLVILAFVCVASLGLRAAVSFERRRVAPRTSRLLEGLGVASSSGAPSSGAPSSEAPSREASSLEASSLELGETRRG